MRERYPKVTLRISEGLTNTIISGLIAKKIDLGLIPAEPMAKALSSTPLLTEPMFLIGPGKFDNGKAGSARAAVTLRKLARYPLLLPSRGNVLREQIETLAKRSGIRLDIREDVDSSAVIKHLVVSGLGYTIQCYSFVHEEVERGQAVRSAAPDPRPLASVVLGAAPRAAAILRQHNDRQCHA